MTQVHTSSKRYSASPSLIRVAGTVIALLLLLLFFIGIGRGLMAKVQVFLVRQEFQSIELATVNYMDRYGRFPGDDGPTEVLRGRGEKWRGIRGGDGNRRLNIDPSLFAGKGETGLFWQHLRAAGLLDGDAQLVGVMALPRTTFGGVLAVSDANILNAMRGHKLCMTGLGGATAASLDSLYDDGRGATGRVRASSSAIQELSYVLRADEVYSNDRVYTVCYALNN